MYTIWSLRHSTTRGNHWVAERQSTEENVQAWLKVFRDDEPTVLFIAAKRRPQIKKQRG